jgi:hypothetical protein
MKKEKEEERKKEGKKNKPGFKSKKVVEAFLHD